MPTMHHFIDQCLMYFTAKNQIEISFPQLILKAKVIKFLKRIFCLVVFFWRVFDKSQFADDTGQWAVSKNIDLAAEYL